MSELQQSIRQSIHTDRAGEPISDSCPFAKSRRRLLTAKRAKVPSSLIAQQKESTLLEASRHAALSPKSVWLPLLQHWRLMSKACRNPATGSRNRSGHCRKHELRRRTALVHRARKLSLRVPSVRRGSRS